MTSPFLIIGLGNPGTNYQKTRHNFGFMVVDNLASEHTVSFKEESNFKALMAIAQIDNLKIILLKPLTFMNLSGDAIQKVVQFYKVPVDRLCVIHDDIDLPFGTMKLTMNQQAGGHQGVESVITALATKEFWRLRIGVANQELQDYRALSNLGEKRAKIEQFVVSSFSPEEEIELPKLITKAHQLVLEKIKEMKMKSIIT